MTDLHRAFCNFKARQLASDWDWWTIFTGPERSGKSTLAIQDAMFTSHDDFSKNWRDRITYDPEEFLAAIEAAPYGASVILDEAAEAWFNLEFQTATNRAISKACTQVGERQLNVGIVTPGIGLIDKAGIRRHRTWANVSAPGFQRGYSEFFAPHWRKFGKHEYPFWTLKMESRFPPLPERVYADYKKFKSKRAAERLARYIDQVEKDQKREDEPPQVLIKKIRSSKQPVERLQTSRGTYDWKLIMYHYKTTENPAKTVAAVLNNDLRRKSSDA